MLVNYEVWRADWSTVTNPHGPCERCAVLDGAIFEEGYGPRTPLHGFCHCRRVLHHQGLVMLPLVPSVDVEDERG